MNRTKTSIDLVFVMVVLLPLWGCQATKSPSPVAVPEEPLAEESENSDNMRVAAFGQSSIVLIGTVSELQAVSFAGVTPTERTMIVRVNEVIDKPKAVLIKEGSDVTIKAKTPSSFTIGTRSVFYAVGYVFGAGVAMEEVNHEILPAAEAEKMKPKKTELMHARKQAVDNTVSKLIQDADIVVIGMVTKINPATLSAADGNIKEIITEHDPEWKEAVIQVESTLKGAAGDKSIVVRFPSSSDVMWYQVPKFTQGQEGIFILKKDQVSGEPKAMLNGAKVNAYIAMMPDSIVFKDKTNYIRSLMK